MMPNDATAQTVLDLRNLRVAFGNAPPVVEGVNLTLHPGQILCLVGESGSGKSVTALALMRLLPPEAQVSADLFRLGTVDMLTAPPKDLENLRGNQVALIFQDGALSLNPLMTIGDQIVEALQTHRPATRPEARKAALSMLDRVQIPGGVERFDLFAHELSGGMRQRVLIAMALMCQPALLIADEPTSSLDAIVQRQVVRLISTLRTQLGAAVLLITHDLGLAEDVADEIAVMFAGHIVECGRRDAVFDDPQHPYTLHLMAALAQDPSGESRIFQSAGAPSDATPDGAGCAFLSRCPVAADPCRKTRPALTALNSTHRVACWRAPLEASLQ